MFRVKITKNFWADEIFKVPWERVPKRAQYLAKHLCKYTLQPLRNRKPKTSIKLISGSRNSVDAARLRRIGLHPSSTTDHYFGNPQRIIGDTPKNRAKIKKYGSIYTYSVGAVDAKPDIPQTKEAFMEYFVWMIELNKKGVIDAGQIILEKGKYSYWIHTSNPVSLVYQDDFIRAMGLQKNPYLTSLNNDGKYKIFKP